MKISFADLSLPKKGAVVAGILSDGALTPAAASLDEKTGGLVGRALAAAPRFKGKREDLLSIVAPSGIDADRILLVGLGDAGKLDAIALQKVGGVVLANLFRMKDAEATILLDGVEAEDSAADVAFGALLRSYRFDKYRTTRKPEALPALAKLTVGSANKAAAKKAFARLEKIADGVFLTRDLVTEPANVLYPESFAERCLELASLGVEVEVLDEKKMKKLGMGALLGVGQGSVRDSRLVVMQWKGGKDKDQPVAFVGKGVTFDTGGISIKPAGGMEDMKWDMGGAGVVTGLMKALAGRKAKVNAVGVIGLAENMPSGSAQRPGDVVTSMSGQTIEVLNTDAEGRLVLADALWYAQDRFKPRFMVNLATLTGAIIVSLGTDYAGLFANDDELSDRLTAAGKAVEEHLWRMPLGDSYDRQIDSDIADVKNISGSRNGGAIVAGQFLQRFVNKTPWAHLDIAGVTWSKKDTPTVPKGGTAFGVRLLDRLVADHYEG
ncbi:leucyl aminopeptidase [Inquilinus sp. CAU 1745]|uniref:leucyl aminopeptidase n=1 Tax=Inquilinus sp. CAU 1745 TaxID=3140369 RepID=UPI00325B7C6B